MPFISASVISPYNSIRGGAEGGLVPGGLLLDLYPNAAAAYSLRKLRTTYSGAAIEARRSDNAIQDIGFVGNELDIASLLTFANGGDVSVAKWYDQSTSGFNVFNNSDSGQPKIVVGGVLQTESSKPCINLSANPDYFLSNDFGSSSVIQKTLIIVGKQTTASDQFGAMVSSFDTTPDNRIFTGRNGNDYASFAAGVGIANAWPTYENQYLLHFSAADAVGNGQWHINSSLAGTGTTTTGYNGIAIGRTRTLTQYAAGTIQEVILYPTDQSANRAGIESNINSNYNIYWDGSQTGLLDDYPNAVAAYSLRALNSAYTGPAIEARRSSDDAVQDIGFLYDGSLDTASLLTFADGGDVFVAKWYDQSGAGNDATQSTASNQPLIVSGGAVNELNGKPTIKFVSAFVTNLNLTQYPFTSGGSATEKSIFAVAENNGTTNQNLYNIADTRDVYALTYNRSGNNTYGFLGANYGSIGGNISGQNIISSFAISPSSKTFNNSIEGLSSNLLRSNFNDISIGSRGGSYAMDGNIQEFVMYESNQSANRVAIESNINTHYTIYP